MTDQPQPTSVDVMKKHAQAEAKLCGVGSARADWAIDSLIAAVRADERARVLVEFRKLAEKWSMEHDIENGGFYDDGRYEQGKNQQRDYCKDEVNSIIKSLETTNPTP